MNTLTEKALAAQIALKFYGERAMRRFHDDERGQGSVEYIGVVLVVVAIITAVITIADNNADGSIANTIIEKLKSAVNKLSTK